MGIQSFRSTSLEAIEVMRQMSVGRTDEQIAATLNRLGLQTGTGNSWDEQRVHSARRYHGLPAFDANRATRFLTLEQAAERLGISANSVRRTIQCEILPASQVVPLAPWQIPLDVLESDRVKHAVKNIKDGVRSPQLRIAQNQQAMFSAGYSPTVYPF